MKRILTWLVAVFVLSAQFAQALPCNMAMCDTSQTQAVQKMVAGPPCHHDMHGAGTQSAQQQLAGGDASACDHLFMADCDKDAKVQTSTLKGDVSSAVFVQKESKKILSDVLMVALTQVNEAAVKAPFILASYKPSASDIYLKTGRFRS